MKTFLAGFMSLMLLMASSSLGAAQSALLFSRETG